MLKYQPSPSCGAGTCRPPSISSLVLVTLQVWAAGSAGPAGIASRRPATTASVTPPGRVNVSSSSEPLSVTAALLGAATGRGATDGPATAWPPSTVTEAEVTRLRPAVSSTARACAAPTYRPRRA